MILVDTSVWIEHLHRGNQQLSHLLGDGLVLCHPFIVGELACGQMRNRSQILSLLVALPTAIIAEHVDAMRLVFDRKLQGRGLGWIDIHLLTSAVLSRCPLLTNDKALASAARLLKVHA